MFGLAPHPKLDRPQRGSPRMFKVDWIEKYFSRVKPSHVIAIWIPILSWCIWHQSQLPGVSPERLLGSLAIGVLIWTLMEYLLHRFLFHFKPSESSEWQQDASFLIHGIHHDYPWDADRLVMPPTAAIVIGAGIWVPVHFIFGAYAFSAFAGVIGGYVWYDLTHYYLHHAKPTTALGKWLRKYHMVHHFATPKVRYGITTPLWDHVFGTYPRDQYVSAPNEAADTLEARQ